MGEKDERTFLDGWQERRGVGDGNFGEEFSEGGVTEELSVFGGCNEGCCGRVYGCGIPDDCVERAWAGVLPVLSGWVGKCPGRHAYGGEWGRGGIFLGRCDVGAAVVHDEDQEQSYAERGHDSPGRSQLMA